MSSSTTASPRLQLGLQRCRWIFTLHRYDSTRDYCALFRSDEYRIKRAVFGYERSTCNDSRHLQGYVEFTRSVRLAHARRILNEAHWEAAAGAALQNFVYCTKSGKFDMVGDFSAEIDGKASARKKRVPVASIVAGLMRDDCSTQIKVFKEYASHPAYFDKTVATLKDLKQSHDLFDTWKQRNLYSWQFLVMRRVFAQDERKVTWIFDQVGNHGKSYLANYLNILYGFQILDGTISTRDLGVVLREGLTGVVIDVARSSEPHLDYIALESLKNGYIVSGKYGGRVRRFQPLRVLILANFHLNLVRL